MHLLVDGRPFAGAPTGIARYVRGIYTELESRPDVEIRFVSRSGSGRGIPPQSRHSPRRLVPPRIRPAARAIVGSWDRYRIGRAMNRYRPDLFHATSTWLPAATLPVPVVATLYDLSPMRFPEFHPADRVREFESAFLSRLDHVEHVVAISEFTRREAIDLLGLDSRRITTVLPGVDAVFRYDASLRDRPGAMLRGATLPARFVLCVGSAEPRKNLPGVIRAVAGMPEDVCLVLAIGDGWMSGEVEQAIARSGLERRLLAIPEPTDSELVLLYHRAVALVYVSLYEGFGLPLIEAMACGCPVVASAVDGLAEAAGDAAVLVDPLDERSIREGIERVGMDANHRDILVTRGLFRVKALGWPKAAGSTMDLFQSLCAP